MNRKKAIILTMAILIVAITVPVSSAHALPARPGESAAQDVLSMTRFGSLPSVQASQVPYEQMFERSGFYAPLEAACSRIRIQVMRCWYRLFYCDTNLLTLERQCYGYDSGW